MLKVIELFAGIGAQCKALQKANIDHQVIAISEIDKYAIQAYNAIHGDTPNLGVSDTQLYKMAGNSIVVNCLTKIFKNLKEII